MTRAFLLAAVCASLLAAAEEPAAPRRYLLGSPLELAVVPAQVQASPRLTQVGVGLGMGWHLNELFAVQVSGSYNYVTALQPSFSERLQRDVEPSVPAPALTVWTALAGIELAPVRGQANVGRFSLVLNAGLGAGSTRHQLMPATNLRPASYGDTGLRFLGSVGAGFRLELTRHFAVRLEVHDVVFNDSVQTVNGCTEADLRAVERRHLLRAWEPQDLVVSSGCRAASFHQTDASGALEVVRASSGASLAHNVTVKLGAAFQF